MKCLKGCRGVWALLLRRGCVFGENGEGVDRLQVEALAAKFADAFADCIGSIEITHTLGGVDIHGFMVGPEQVSCRTFLQPIALAFNAVGFVACGMVWNAARIFHGRATNWPGILCGALVWSAVLLILQPGADMLRMTIGAGVVAAYAVLTANELWVERRKAYKRRWPTIVIPMLHGFVLMLPILLGDILHADAGSFANSIWVSVFTIELVLYAVGTVFIIFMLVSERTISAHRVAALLDPLTGIFNRRGFVEATMRVIAREAGANRPVTVMILDIDHFKSINDRFGHAAGDEVLKEFAQIVAGMLRVTDLCGRIGGEEFAALLPCPIEEALIAAERVRDAFANAGLVVDQTSVDTTVSIGVADGPVGTELDVLLAAADAALYKAKRSGRNRVETASERPSPAGREPRISDVAAPRAIGIVRRRAVGMRELRV